MILEDKHIDYLKLVELKKVKLWWNPPKTLSKYLYIDWDDRNLEINQIVAAQMHALGLTHIVSEKNSLRVVLTERGKSILLDEAEAWS